MPSQQTITRTAQILEILPDAPPRLLTAERLTQNGRPGRIFQQLLPVPEPNFFTVSQRRPVKAIPSRSPSRRNGQAINTTLIYPILHCRLPRWKPLSKS